MSPATSPNKGKRNACDDDDFYDPSFSILPDESDCDEEIPGIPLAAKGKARAYKGDPEPPHPYIHIPDELRVGPDQLSALLAPDSTSDINTPGLTATHTDEGDDVNSAFDGTPVSLAEVVPEIATSAEAWASENTPLLQEYRDRQIDPPLGHKLEINFGERSKFVGGFLSQLSERASPLMSSGENGVTGSTEMLDGFLDIHNWAREYLRRIGQGQADDLVSVIYVIMANVFYDCHLDLVDSITTRALESMRASSRSRLKLQDFALTYELNISQTFPFGVQASSAVEKAIEALHRDRADLQLPMLQTEHETRFGRKVIFSSKGKSYYKDEQEKANKAAKTRALRPSKDKTSDMGTLTPEHARARRLDSTIPIFSAPSISIPSTGPSIAGQSKEPAGAQTATNESADIHDAGLAPLNFKSMCPNCGHTTNFHVSPRTSLLSVSSWKPLASDRKESHVQMPEVTSHMATTQNVSVAAIAGHGRARSSGAGGARPSRISVNTDVSVADPTGKATFQFNTVPSFRAPMDRGKATRYRRCKNTSQSDRAPRTPVPQTTDPQQTPLSFSTSNKRNTRTLGDRNQRHSLGIPAAALPNCCSIHGQEPPSPSPSTNKPPLAGHLGKIKTPPAVSPRSAPRMVPKTSIRDLANDGKTCVTVEQPVASGISEDEVTTLSGRHDFTFQSCLPTRSGAEQEIVTTSGVGWTISLLPESSNGLAKDRILSGQKPPNSPTDAGDVPAVTLDETLTPSDKDVHRISADLQRQSPLRSNSQRSNLVPPAHQSAQIGGRGVAGPPSSIPSTERWVNTGVASPMVEALGSHDTDSEIEVAVLFRNDRRMSALEQKGGGKIHRDVAEVKTDGPQSSASAATVIAAVPSVLQPDTGRGKEVTTAVSEPSSLRRSLRPRRKKQRFQ